MNQGFPDGHSTAKSGSRVLLVSVSNWCKRFAQDIHVMISSMSNVIYACLLVINFCIGLMAGTMRHLRHSAQSPYLQGGISGPMAGLMGGMGLMGGNNGGVMTGKCILRVFSVEFNSRCFYLSYRLYSSRILPCTITFTNVIFILCWNSSYRCLQYFSRKRCRQTQYPSMFRY